MRVGLEPLRRALNTDSVEQLENTPPNSVPVQCRVQPQGFAELTLDDVQWIERTHGLLKNHRHLITAQFSQSGRIHPQQLLTAQPDAAFGLAAGR